MGVATCRGRRGFFPEISITCNKSAHPRGSDRRLVWGATADLGDEFHVPWPDWPHWARSWKPPRAEQSRSASPTARAGQPLLALQAGKPGRAPGSHQCPLRNSSTPEDEENRAIPFVTNLNPTCCCFVRTASRSAAKAHGAVGLITATHRHGSHTHQPSRSSTELCHRRSTFQIYI